MLDTLEQVEAPHELYPFTGHDRCDAARNRSEQAYHRATKGDREMLFCDHHYKQHADALLTDGWAIESDLQALADLGNPLDVSVNA